MRQPDRERDVAPEEESGEAETEEADDREGARLRVRDRECDKDRSGYAQERYPSRDSLERAKQALSTSTADQTDAD